MASLTQRRSTDPNTWTVKGLLAQNLPLNLISHDYVMLATFLILGVLRSKSTANSKKYLNQYIVGPKFFNQRS